MTCRTLKLCDGYPCKHTEAARALKRCKRRGRTCSKEKLAYNARTLKATTAQRCKSRKLVQFGKAECRGNNADRAASNGKPYKYVSPERPTTKTQSNKKQGYYPSYHRIEDIASPMLQELHKLKGICSAAGSIG